MRALSQMDKLEHAGIPHSLDNREAISFYVSHLVLDGLETGLSLKQIGEAIDTNPMMRGLTSMDKYPGISIDLELRMHDDAVYYLNRRGLCDAEGNVIADADMANPDAFFAQVVGVRITDSKPTRIEKKPSLTDKSIISLKRELGFDPITNYITREGFGNIFDGDIPSSITVPFEIDEIQVELANELKLHTKDPSEDFTGIIEGELDLADLLHKDLTNLVKNIPSKYQAINEFIQMTHEFHSLESSITSGLRSNSRTWGWHKTRNIVLSRTDVYDNTNNRIKLWKIFSESGVSPNIAYFSNPKEYETIRDIIFKEKYDFALRNEFQFENLYPDLNSLIRDFPFDFANDEHAEIHKTRRVLHNIESYNLDVQAINEFMLTKKSPCDVCQVVFFVCKEVIYPHYGIIPQDSHLFVAYKDYFFREDIMNAVNNAGFRDSLIQSLHSLGYTNFDVASFKSKFDQFFLGRTISDHQERTNEFLYYLI